MTIQVTDKVVQYALKHLVDVVTGLARAPTSSQTFQEQELQVQRFLMEEVAPKLGVSKNAVKTMVLRSASGGSEAIGAAIDEYARNVGAMMVLMTRHAKPQLQEMFTARSRSLV
ncbi:hypothetical protein WJX84_001362 [Apatococcus fuscideae]|uniref:Uncharacterized protein n=1 Tax=Apatococcus fuscideae TaxID=2026836 RepID=A0AAW1T9J6_9CHLO